MTTGAPQDCPDPAPLATVVTVTYNTEAVDLTWIPESAPVLIVQNDSLFRAASVIHPNAKLIGTGTNVGFGAAVNEALPFVRTPRLILVNPDTRLTDEHWGHLSHAADDEVVVVPLNDGEGNPTSVVSAYPTPASLVLTALRVGRFVPRSSRARHVLAPLLGRWGRSHAASLTASCRAGRWPITTHWPVSAVCSYPTELVRAAGGFDPRYFLYLEDTDLARRLADRTPELQVVVADLVPGIHLVGGTASDPPSRRRAHLEQARSARRYARSQSGMAWKVAAAAATVIVWAEGR